MRPFLPFVLVTALLCCTTVAQAQRVTPPLISAQRVPPRVLVATPALSARWSEQPDFRGRREQSPVVAATVGTIVGSGVAVIAVVLVRQVGCVLPFTCPVSQGVTITSAVIGGVAGAAIGVGSGGLRSSCTQRVRRTHGALGAAVGGAIGIGVGAIFGESPALIAGWAGGAAGAVLANKDCFHW